MTTFVLCAFAFLTAFIGASLGSFLNVVIWRVPEKASLMSPPSHCPKCGSPVRWHDNIPIVSWFLLRGKCRDCREPISFRYPLVESLVCFVALTFCASILFGGWTGTRFQCLSWKGFTNAFEAWKPILANEFSEASAESRLESQLTTFIFDDFIRLLFMTVGLSVYVTLLASVELMLGFVRFDQKQAPRSLLIASSVVVLLAIPMILWLNSSDPSCQIRRLWILVQSVVLGSVPAFVVKKGRRVEFMLLGATWGVVSGMILALPGSFLCLVIASVFRKKFGRDLLGVIFYVVIAFLLVAQFVFSLLF